MKATCGALTRRGTACQCKRLLRGGRCRFHGGLSTGPRTPEGRRIALEALQRARADPLIRQAIGDRLRALWADPGYRLRVMAGRWRSLDARAWQRVQAGTPAAVAAYLAQRRRWRRTLDALRAAVG